MTNFPTWDELTVVEQLQCTYSDYYKDVHGFRPRGMAPELWNSEQWLRDEIAELDRIAPAIFAEEEAASQRQIAAFERRVNTAIELSAKDRETAIRWLQQADDCEGDLDHFSWKNSLPFGYLKEQK